MDEFLHTESDIKGNVLQNVYFTISMHRHP